MGDPEGFHQLLVRPPHCADGVIEISSAWRSRAVRKLNVLKFIKAPKIRYLCSNHDPTSNQISWGSIIFSAGRSRAWRLAI